MKKIVLWLMLVVLMLFGAVAMADGTSLYGNPDTTLDNPKSLPYSSNFSFQKGSTTVSLISSSKSITVNLKNTYLAKNRSAKITIKVCYWNGSTWISSGSSSVMINDTEGNYSKNFTVPANKPFYVRLSKTDYTDYYAKGTLTVE